MTDVEGIRWGIAGPGAIATQFAEGMRERRRRHGRRRRVALRSSAAQAFATRFDITRSYGSYEELAADADVDAVYVATPHSRHAADTLLFLAAGKHVLCEKPFTLNADADERRSCTPQPNRSASSWKRCGRASSRPTSLCASSSTRARIGEPLLVEADFGWRSPVVPTDRHFDLEQGGGALLDLGVYTVQLSQFVLGHTGRRSSRKVTSAAPASTNVSAAVLHYPDGRLGVVQGGDPHTDDLHRAHRGHRGCRSTCPPSCTARTISSCATPAGEQRIDAPWEGEGLRFQVDEVHRCLDAGLLREPADARGRRRSRSPRCSTPSAPRSGAVPGRMSVTSRRRRSPEGGAGDDCPASTRRCSRRMPRAELDVAGRPRRADRRRPRRTRRRDVLAEIEIVVGSWGCNVLDDALLARMPKLRLLAYAAGTVKTTVTPGDVGTRRRRVERGRGQRRSGRRVHVRGDRDDRQGRVPDPRPSPRRPRPRTGRRGRADR